MKISSLLPLSMAALLIGCADIPSRAFGERGTPESLLDVSSEIVTVELISGSSMNEIVEWIEVDQPSRAEIHCAEGNILCDQAEETFALYGVEYDWVPANFSEVHLMYERVIAHDCENRYIDNRINPYNLNHPAFGCSIASNIVQMVSDRRQFINPDLLPPIDGQTAVQGVTRYREFDSQDYFREDVTIDSVRTN